MNELYEGITNMLVEMVIIDIIKDKIAAGKELSKEEQEKILQTLYSYAKKKLAEYKAAKSTKTMISLRAVSIVTGLSGEKYKGIATATKAMSTGVKNSKDNYNQLLRGVSMTDKNPIRENFTTLLAQYNSIEKYDVLLLELMKVAIDRSNTYKKDFATSIGEEDQAKLAEAREEIVSLGKKYI